MDCKGCRQQLSPYLEGELSASARQQMAAHLTACSSCAAELAALKQTLSDLKRLPQVPVPAEFRQAVWKRIEAPGFGTRLREWLLEPWYLKLPVEALATAAVVLLIVQVSRVTGPQLAKQEAASDRTEEQRYSNKLALREKEAKPQAAAPAELESAVVSGEKARQGRLARSIGVPAVPPLHVRLYVADLAEAKRRVELFFTADSSIPFKASAPTQYRAVLSSAQLDAFLKHLSAIGELDAVEPEERAADVSPVILDLVPI